MSAFFNLKALQMAAAVAIGNGIAVLLLPAHTVAAMWHGSRLDGIIYSIILGASIGYSVGLARERSRKSQDERDTD